MKFASRTRPQSDLPGVIGAARVDRRIRALIPRLREGDVAVIDHLDLDRANAQAMVDAGVRAVLNASAMSSGRFPNLGPQVLADAGVAMVERIGPDLFDAVREGDALRVHDEKIHTARERVLDGDVLDATGARQQSADARVGLAHQLDSFTHNSSEFLRREQDVLLHGQGVPTPSTKLADRPVVVVAPGRDHVEELKAVRRFITEQGPVLIGVDRGADALRAAGHRPDKIGRAHV